MALFASNLAPASTDRALGAAKIKRSLRFYEPNPSDQNSTAATYLSRTPSSTGSQKIWTFSSWMKKFNCHGTGNDSAAYIYGAYSGSDYFAFYFQDDEIHTYYAPGNNYGTTGDRKFRDTTSWFHLVHQVDATNTVQKIWINGEELSLNSSRNPGNSDYPMNESGVPFVLGKASWKGNGFNGYLAEVHYIDGSLVAPTDFGFTDPVTNNWMPKRYEGTHGTNGFYLDFSDNSSTSTLGIDKSLNGNDLAATNLSVAAWPDTDSVIDTPTNSFNTFNDNDKNTNVPLANGGLQTAATATGGHYPAFTTTAIKSGKWYLEWKYLTNDSGLPSIMEAQHDSGSHNQDSTVGNNTSTVNKRGYGLLPGDGRTSHNGTLASYGSAISSSDTAQCAFDADTGKIYWGKNNTWFNSGNPETGANPAFSGIDMTKEWLFTWHVYGNNNNVSVNFGSQGFTYTPPSGFRALSSKNLSLNQTPSAIKPKKHFDVLTWTGNATARTITGLEFKPDLVWVKCRSNGHDHQFTDSVRGSQYALRANEQNAEDDWGSGGMGSYVDGGFILNDTSNGRYNENSQTFVAWCWKGGGNSHTYNIDGTGYATAAAAGLDGGTIDPTGASINTESGFSIVTYTANGTNGATIAHGLGKKPAWIIIKCRSNADNWMVYHQQSNEGSSPEDFYLELNTTASTTDSPNMLNDTAPTDTLITLNNDGSVNSGSRTYVMYCWAEIPGFSKFGEYRARDADYTGPYIHTGFKPAWVMSKGLSLSWQDWCIFDDKRKTLSGSGNRIDGKLGANQEIVEAKDDYNVVDFLANGWRVSGRSASDINYGSGYPKQLYMAFAEQSDVTSFDTFPNAR